ncbi:hypothetical protein C8F01DRAFT_1366468 [Mycena amicta]|nr:hypothetical protein C8F01DRAFT_1366468 [Mycena amicta]
MRLKTVFAFLAYGCWATAQDGFNSVEQNITSNVSPFSGQVMELQYMSDQKTILAVVNPGLFWQSSDEGRTWSQPLLDFPFATTVLQHPHAPSRAYLLTSLNFHFHTTNYGRMWEAFSAPTGPSEEPTLSLEFHPDDPDMLLWTGEAGCEYVGNDLQCRAETYYSRNNGLSWAFVQDGVGKCAWMRELLLSVSAEGTTILCSSSSNGDIGQNKMSLASGSRYFSSPTTLFDEIAGFVNLPGHLLVSEKPSSRIQISRDGQHFEPAIFPLNVRLNASSWSVLPSHSESIFLLLTPPTPNTYWGTMLKSDASGTRFVQALEYVNADQGGVDFVRIAAAGVELLLANVVNNPQDASQTGRKELQTRISLNDGGEWRALIPPSLDSLGSAYNCAREGHSEASACALHINPILSDSQLWTHHSPSVPGLLIANGNVGPSLLGEEEFRLRNTFMSRDAGLSWVELHKGPHVWSVGDSGGVLVMARSGFHTDQVVYSLDGGVSWRAHAFLQAGSQSESESESARPGGIERMYIWWIKTAPAGQSRRFVVAGFDWKTYQLTLVHLDFTKRFETIGKCGEDDFEWWSPGCSFGRKTSYRRKAQNSTCATGSGFHLERRESECACSIMDFECKNDHFRDENNECIPLTEASHWHSPAEPKENGCRNDEKFWYTPSPYRKISLSTCKGGHALDEDVPHPCTVTEHNDRDLAFSDMRIALILLPMLFIPCILVTIWQCRVKARANFGSVRGLEEQGYQVRRHWRLNLHFKRSASGTYVCACCRAFVARCQRATGSGLASSSKSINTHQQPAIEIQASAFKNMVSPCFIPGLLFIIDFQNSVLDIANSVNPVIGQFNAFGANQMWTFNPVDDDQELFKIQSALGDPFLTFVPTGDGAPLFSQATTDADGTVFSMICNPADAPSGSVIHNATGLALTAWHQEDGSTITPVTFEEYTGRTEQTFFFVTEFFCVPKAQEQVH